MFPEMCWVSTGLPDYVAPGAPVICQCRKSAPELPRANTCPPRQPLSGSAQPGRAMLHWYTVSWSVAGQPPQVLTAHARPQKAFCWQDSHHLLALHHGWLHRQAHPFPQHARSQAAALTCPWCTSSRYARLPSAPLLHTHVGEDTSYGPACMVQAHAPMESDLTALKADRAGLYCSAAGAAGAACTCAKAGRDLRHLCHACCMYPGSA